MELILALILGIFTGHLFKLPEQIKPWFNYLITGSLALLILTLGVKIGGNPKILSSLGTLGAQALFLTILGTGGSILGVWIIERVLIIKKDDNTLEVEETDFNPFKAMGVIGGLLVAGILTGYRFIDPASLVGLDRVVTLALCLLLFGVGVDLGDHWEIWSRIKDLGWSITLVPVGLMAGGIIGTLIGGLILGISFPISLATGAGSGFYSYTGVIVAKSIDAQAGALAFLTNFFRELLSFFIIPLLGVKLEGSLAAIAPGGATTMDTTLPLISKALGPQYAVIALINGVIVSALVPIVVPLLLRL